MERYLLRTDAQAESFRLRFQDVIGEKSLDVERWFNALPLFTWVRLRIRPGEEEAAIGLLCLLAIEGRIVITFSSDMASIQRGTHSMKEYRSWLARHSYRRKVNVISNQIQK